jgi:hypothetical protein
VKRLSLLSLILLVFGMAPAMFADVVDYMLNVNGTTYCPSYTAATCDNYTGFGGAGASSTIDDSYGGTGLGSVSMNFTSPGTYDVGLWLFEELFPATGQNEYGASSGSPAAGQTWQIDTPDYDYVSGFDPNFGGLAVGAGSIVANTAANTLDNTNYVPGTDSQYNFDCSGMTTCNDYTSMALAFHFSVGAGEQAHVSFLMSTTKPSSGFYLMQVAPVDDANSEEIDYYFNGAVSISPVGEGGGGEVPEPKSFGLMLAAGLLVLLARRRRVVA